MMVTDGLFYSLGVLALAMAYLAFFTKAIPLGSEKAKTIYGVTCLVISILLIFAGPELFVIQK